MVHPDGIPTVSLEDMSPSNFSELANFLGGYLNEDWDLDYASLDEVLEDFEGHATASEVEALTRDLRRALALDISESALGELLRGLGADIATAPFGGPRRLLEAVLRRLERADDGGEAGASPHEVAPWVERSDLLQDLAAALSGFGAVAVTGVGGVGKTTLARQFFDRHRGEYPGGVDFINAGRARPEELGLIVRRQLERERALLIIDEAELVDADWLQATVTSRPAHLHVMLVGRTAPDLATPALPIVSVPRFTTAEIEAYLGSVPPDVSHAIADLSAGLPLAAALAVTGWQSGHFSPEVLRQLLTRDWPGITDPGGHPLWPPEGSTVEVPELVSELRSSLATLTSSHRGSAVEDWATRWLRERGVTVQPTRLTLEHGGSVHVAEHAAHGRFLYAVGVAGWRSQPVDVDLIARVGAETAAEERVVVELLTLRGEAFEERATVHRVVDRGEYLELVLGLSARGAKNG
jgi:hypothetical protein